MMDLIPYIVGAVLAVLGLGGLWVKAENLGKAKKEAEHARQREKDLDRIKRAADARPSGSVHDDPFNRDNG
ncbi:hypothetical protein GCM10011385_00280 [Nitratireductor aestuarii]|uniref:Uncharacterized protein n=1 Tax=Nitratireductor aestuarii TaxID=1735103 RepID=A0A916RCW8_9HYPH|nr:hypothetical protein [Nitratireductor aestuarii]GGA50982.1 hypothetical protein GCM10011385_00280 [Nitratireductor aestuarii]